MAILLNSKQKKHEHIHNNAIEIKNLSFSYGKKEKQLNKININFHKGEWTTIIGPNGSGKSTLAKNIIRTLKFQIGDIIVNNKNIKQFKNKEYAKIIAYIPQMIDIPEGTSVYDFVSFGRNPWLGFLSRLGPKDKEIIELSMIKVGVWEWKDKMIEDLSGGQRQRVLVAMAMAQDTEIIILDEPTTYLDIKAQYELLELMNLLHEKGKTIITILHDINQAVQYSDEIIILNNGAVYDYGTPEKVVTEEMLLNVYKIKTKLFVINNRKYLADVKIIK